MLRNVTPVCLCLFTHHAHRLTLIIRYVVDQNVTENGATIGGPGFATKSEPTSESLDPAPILLHVDVQKKPKAEDSFSSFNSASPVDYSSFSGFYRANPTVKGFVRSVSFTRQECLLQRG